MTAALANQRKELLFPHDVFSQLVYAAPEPTKVNLLTYFCPIPIADITNLLARQNNVTERDLTTFKLAKRKLMQEVYQSVATLIFAIINTDGIARLRSSKHTLESVLDNEEHNDILQEAHGIVDEAERQIEFLAAYPTDLQACRKISDSCTRYDTLIRERVQQIFLQKRQSSRTMGLYSNYGANHHGVEYTSFDAILEYVGAAGYGRTVEQGGMDPRREESWDRFHLRIWTNAGILFNLKTTPNSFSVVDPFYNFDQNSRLKCALQPIELDIMSASPVIYASLLEEMQTRLKARFEFKEVIVGDRKMLVYCPEKRLLEAGN